MDKNRDRQTDRQTYRELQTHTDVVWQLLIAMRTDACVVTFSVTTRTNTTQINVPLTLVDV